MAKNKLVEVPINPSRCLRNLSKYQDAVISLYTYVQAVMEYIPKEAQHTMQQKIDLLAEFYHAE